LEGVRKGGRCYLEVDESSVFLDQSFYLLGVSCSALDVNGSVTEDLLDFLRGGREGGREGGRGMVG